MYTNKNMWLIIRCHITNDDVILSDAHFVRLQAHFAYRRQHILITLFIYYPANNVYMQIVTSASMG